MRNTNSKKKKNKFDLFFFFYSFSFFFLFVQYLHPPESPSTTHGSDMPNDWRYDFEFSILHGVSLGVSTSYNYSGDAK